MTRVDSSSVQTSSSCFTRPYRLTAMVLLALGLNAVIFKVVRNPLIARRALVLTWATASICGLIELLFYCSAKMSDSVSKDGGILNMRSSDDEGKSNEKPKEEKRRDPFDPSGTERHGRSREKGEGVSDPPKYSIPTEAVSKDKAGARRRK